jgi:catenin alpha
MQLKFLFLMNFLPSPSQSPIVVWKMKAPEKKPLVRPEKPEEVRAKVRRASQKKTQNPVHALSEFQSPSDNI